MALDLSSLQRAITSLEKAVTYTIKKENETLVDSDEMDVIIAGVIQNFEFTYELCWKFMKRWIEENISRDEVDGVTRHELFRIAAENRLIDDIEKWFYFHKARNKTSHIYDTHIAQEVYNITKEFLPEAKKFLEKIETRND